MTKPIKTSFYPIADYKFLIVNCSIHTFERHPLGCGMAETGEELQRIRLAENAAHHRQARHPALHRVLLPDIIACSHPYRFMPDSEFVTPPFNSELRSISLP